MTEKPIVGARGLLNSKSFGVLSTISLKLEGFPFGSVVPYCLDADGMPIVLISTIAQHTKNISNDKRCSITVLKGNNDVQSNGRLCIIGNMDRISDDETDTKERYYRHFPASRSYSEAHDFFFYRLSPVSIRYIAGFGAIHWLEAHDFLIQNPFHGNGENRVVDHMNKDHSEALRSYCKHYKNMEIAPDESVRMVGIDSIGFDIFVGKRKVRFDFEAPVMDALAAREVFVALSKGLS